MIVLDASAVVAVLLETGPETEPIRERIEDPDQSVHAPHLLDVEVLSVLRRHATHDLLDLERAATALRDYLSIRITRYPHIPLAERIWELRANLSAYGAAYVALAEALDAPLVTTDARLARTPGHRARVELF